MEHPQDAVQPERIAVRFGSPGVSQIQRLLCTCAPVHDYTGRAVARVGVFAHAADEQPFSGEQPSAVMELARLISLRLGHFSSLPRPASSFQLPAQLPQLGGNREAGSSEARERTASARRRWKRKR